MEHILNLEQVKKYYGGLHIYTSDPAVIAEGVKYLRIVALSYVLMAATQVYLYIMRSIEQVVIATVVYSASLVCNVLVNALLIFGLFGLPKMGIMGAAIGTLTARIVELIIVIWYAKVKNHDVRFHPVYMRKIDKVLLKDFLIYASPVILNEMMWGLGSTANTAVIGHLEVLRWQQIPWRRLQDSWQRWLPLVYPMRLPFILVRPSVQKSFIWQKSMEKDFLWLSIITGAVGGGIILIAAPIANHVMTLSQEAQGYLYFMFFVMSYFTLCQAINTTLWWVYSGQEEIPGLV